MTNENIGGTPNSFFSMDIGNEKRDSDPALSTDDSLPTETSSLAEVSTATGSSDMPHDARRILVHLMRQGVIISSQKPKAFDLACRYEAFIRRHLSEVYLQLVLDRKSGIAFVATADSEHGDAIVDDDELAEDFSTLIPKRTLSLYDTLILLVLRKHYQDRESTGEQKITIDIERLESYLTPFLPLTDHASKDRKKLLIRVKEMVKRKILSTIRGTEDRFEITPVIRYVVSASFLESLLAEYTVLASDQVWEENTNDGRLF